MSALSPGFLTALAVTLLLAGPVAAQTAKPTPPAPPAKPAPVAKSAPAAAGAPKQIGKFDDWTAATYQESGTTACYAFTRAQASTPAVNGRGPVIITLTQRPTLRDSVAIDAGFAYPANAAVVVKVDTVSLDFFTDKRTAFARDGKAAAAAFGRGAKIVAASPRAQGGPVSDTFSLKGFTAAYAAINKACPPK